MRISLHSPTSQSIENHGIFDIMRFQFLSQFNNLSNSTCPTSPGTFIAIALNGRVHREAMRAAEMRIGCGTLCWLLLLRLGSQRFGFDFGDIWTRFDYV
jgi:hypothetical protein